MSGGSQGLAKLRSRMTCGFRNRGLCAPIVAAVLRFREVLEDLLFLKAYVLYSNHLGSDRRTI
jgi:hypothetical protein